MRFDMTRAWNEAMAAIGANREVMLVVAGVFFLLPSLLFAFLFADVQAEAMAEVQKMLAGHQPDEAALSAALSGTYVVVAFVLTLVQLTGFIALLALLDPSERPTVGQAITTGLRSLPTLIGAILIYVLGYMVVSFALGIVIGLLAVLLGPEMVVVLALLVIVPLVVWAMVRLSLTMPVIVFEKQFNPLTALLRSWKLTQGGALRLFLFYFLLMVAYIVISLVVSGIFLTFLMGAMGQGTAVLFVASLISGLLSAAMNTIFTAALASAYRQLAGPSAKDFEKTFG